MKLSIQGRYTAEVYDSEGRLVSTLAWENSLVNAALQDMLSVYFNAGTQKTTFYVGLIDNAAYAGINIADTMGSHAGWAENTAYSGGARPTWTANAPTILNPGATITTSGTVNFTMNAGATIKGAFLTTSNTQGGTSGLLVSEGVLSALQTLVSGQVLKLTWSCTLTATN